MAIIANTATSIGAIGTREDLEDVIYLISPTETPFLSNCNQGKATQTLHEWQTDTLAAAVNNAQIEGDDYPGGYDPTTETTRLSNLCQISSKKGIISKTRQASTQAGRSNEVKRQELKKGQELKRDMEVALTGNGAKTLGSTTVARQLGGFESWIQTNSNRNATGADPVNPGDAPTDGAARAFSEADVKTVLQSVFNNGGNPKTIMVGAFNKQAFSGFQGRATARQNIDKDAIQAAAQIYASDFGQLEVVPNRFQRSRSALVIDPQFWEVAYLRKIHKQELAQTGDADKFAIVCEYTLVSRNEAASGIIADLTVA